MKKMLLLSLSMVTVNFLFAQLTIAPNKTAGYLASKLVATSGTLGVLVSNETLTCDSNANGEFTAISNLGIADGIALGSGDIASNVLLNSFGLDGLPSEFASTTNGAAGDLQLGAIVMAATYDACILEFDLQPVGNFVEFEYVFGSEEYPEFNCSAFNDIFGFFISGPGFAGPTNIALLPSSTTEVSINSINDGSVTSCVSNTALYVTNTDTVCTMDGFTVPLIAHANVTPGATYHLKLAIADVMDGILNSYVLLKANSLKSGGSALSSSDVLLENGLKVYPTLMNDQLKIQNIGQQTWSISLIDIHHRQVFHTTCKASQDQLSIDVSAFPKGFYMLQATNKQSNEVFTQKLIKE